MPFDEGAGRLGLTVGQTLVVSGLLGAWSWGIAVSGTTTLAVTALCIQSMFLICAAWRMVLIAAARSPPPPSPAPAAWPRYTVLVALHDEALIMDQLVERLSRIDYPADRIEGLLLLEAHDLDTIDAASRADRPAWLKAVVVPSGGPATKPRALNHGLSCTTGDLLVVFDAEDDPDPLQLREAAARFDAGPPELACLQAPLRIRRLDRSRAGSSFLDRQFAAEYAALFEVILPGMARMGLPFPLGGTSNHFRVDSLRAVGGWDVYNVTEDADLGFRLWRNGRRQAMLARPTYETPPGDMDSWLPQRARWMKGFMQTWGVHTRHGRGLGWRGVLSLTMTLGAAIGAAAVHAVSLAWIAVAVLIAGSSGLPPATPLFSMGVLIVGTLTAWATCAAGARRAQIPYTLRDMMLAPFYWALLTLALAHALWRLVREPHAWDKTCHWPDAQYPGTVEATVAGGLAQRPFALLPVASEPLPGE